jgi:hypothetical protein
MADNDASYMRCLAFGIFVGMTGAAILWGPGGMFVFLGAAIVAVTLAGMAMDR